MKSILIVIAALSTTTSLNAQQQRSIPLSGIRYDVTLDSATASSRTISVAMTFATAAPGTVLLSLPAWTPGEYEIQNYARFVSDFGASSGRDPLQWDKLDPDTWRVVATRGGEIAVHFQFKADSLDNAISWTKPNFGFFNGTNLFMYPEGQGTDFAATVTVHTTPTWQIATGMPRTSDSTFTASNYHDLVDFPFFVGRFDIDSTQVSGKTVRFASFPVGSITPAVRNGVFGQLKKIIPRQAAVFGEIPWTDYTILQVADESFSLGAAAGLEHQNSHFDIISPIVLGNPILASLYSHEIFHAWNVKRLRPVEMTPYMYDREQPTTLLWMSEGITDYYADLTEVRAKVTTPRSFYSTTAGKIDNIAEAVPTALEDASLSTWISPVNGTKDLYYDKGSVAGMLLDILVRDASDNRKSLDTVMRDLYESTYKKGRGFTGADFWSSASRAAKGKSFADFEKRYIDGREVFPYDSVFPLAGLRLMIERTVTPSLGISVSGDDQGLRVVQVVVSGPGAVAGVQLGDYLQTVGGLDTADPAFPDKFNAKFGSTPPGSTIPVEIRRGTQRLTLNAPVRFNTAEGRRLIEMTNASPKAIRVRDGLLNGTLQQ
ncbi:MAG TPA: PDZ domain-containing protein [Gemmatimonadaceae bacterium]|nr:PDZ domain-containing protein [Gemmatimonadaceae bacterium]